MEKSLHPRWNSIKHIMWFIAMIEVLLLFLAIIAGHTCGYRISFIAHGILGRFVGGSLLFLLLGIILIDSVMQSIKKLRNRTRKDAS